MAEFTCPKCDKVTEIKGVYSPPEPAMYHLGGLYYEEVECSCGYELTAQDVDALRAQDEKAYDALEPQDFTGWI